MSLEFIIKQIVLEKGQDFLTNKYFLNYISDYDNKVFNPPALKTILKTIINDGYANELLSSGKDNVQVTINSITSKLSNLYGYSEDNTKYLLNCLAFGLGCAIMYTKRCMYSPSRPESPALYIVSISSL